jgi:hypothetical protein
MIALQKFHAVLASRSVDYGRKRRRSPADLSGHSLFRVARRFVPLLLRTRRDAVPPGSGGFSSRASVWFSLACPRWRGSG